MLAGRGWCPECRKFVLVWGDPYTPMVITFLAFVAIGVWLPAPLGKGVDLAFPMGAIVLVAGGFLWVKSLSNYRCSSCGTRCLPSSPGTLAPKGNISQRNSSSRRRKRYEEEEEGEEEEEEERRR